MFLTLRWGQKWPHIFLHLPNNRSGQSGVKTHVCVSLCLEEEQRTRNAGEEVLSGDAVSCVSDSAADRPGLLPDSSGCAPLGVSLETQTHQLHTGCVHTNPAKRQLTTSLAVRL